MNARKIEYFIMIGNITPNITKAKLDSIKISNPNHMNQFFHHFSDVLCQSTCVLPGIFTRSVSVRI